MGVRDDIISAAESYIGVPYKGIYQGTGPEDGGFTCSGFTWRCYSDAGVDIPICQGISSYYTGSYNGWDTQAGWVLSNGHYTDDVDDLEVADLVFYSPVGDMERTGHVGIYYGDGQVIHANGAPVSIDRVNAGGTFVGGGWPLSDLPESSGSGGGGTPSIHPVELSLVCIGERNIRDRPSTVSGNVVDQYDDGDSFNADGICLSDDRIWATYTGMSSGKQRYVAIADLDGMREE